MKGFPKLTLTALNEQIIFRKGPYAKVDVGGFVWNIIRENIDMQEHWRYFHDEFWEIEQKRHTGNLHGRFVDVPGTSPRRSASRRRRGLLRLKSHLRSCKSFSAMS